MQKDISIITLFIIVGMFAAAGTQYYLNNQPKEEVVFYDKDRTTEIQEITQKMRVASVDPWEQILHADGSIGMEHAVSVIDTTGHRRFVDWYSEEFEGKLEVGDIVSATMGVLIDYDNLKLNVQWIRINFKITVEEVK